MTALHPSEVAAPAHWATIAWAMPVALAAAALVAVAALSAQAALGMLAPVPQVVHVPVPPPVAAPAEPDGAAVASPASGATGTAWLPPVPSFAARTIGDANVTPARPFSVIGVAAVDRGRALECLTATLYYEAASEPDDGQRAVAQVVLNRVRHPAFPGTVCGVVYQGSEKSGCQFSFACDGALARAPAPAAWSRAARIAAAALNGYVFAGVGLATHYHTYAVTPSWNRTLVMTDAVGAHFFHRWKGYWGTASAFVQRYRGHEPVPGPHAVAAVVAKVPVATAAPMAASAMPVVATPRMEAQPAHAGSGEPIVMPVPAESQVLERWKDSGKPIR